MTPRTYYILHLIAYIACAICIAGSIHHPALLVLVGPLIILAEYFYFLYKS